METETITKALASLGNEFHKVKKQIYILTERITRLNLGSDSRMIKYLPPWKASIWAHRNIFKFGFKELKKKGYKHGIKSLRLGPLGIMWGSHRSN